MFRWDEETNSHTNNVHHLRSPSADHSRQCAVTSLSLCPCHNKQTASIAKFNTIKEGASPHQRTHQAAPISGWHLAEESKLQDHKHRVSVLHACLLYFGWYQIILAGDRKGARSKHNGWKLSGWESHYITPTCQIDTNLAMKHSH